MCMFPQSILRELHHENIIRCFDFFMNSEKAYIVLEFVEGVDQLKLFCSNILTSSQSTGDLFENMTAAQTIPEHEARDIMRKLLSALAYLRTKSIVHRDLKPENILLRVSRRE